jgi:hypothetical protein
VVGEKRDGKNNAEEKCGGFHRLEFLQITPPTRTRKKAAAKIFAAAKFWNRSLRRAPLSA